jgi:DNA-binding transcriptional MerR regulator
MSNFHLSNLISSYDASVLLNCDQRTLRRYREKGIIKRQKIKGLVYYTTEDVLKLKSILEKNTKDLKIDTRIAYLEQKVESLQKSLSMVCNILQFGVDSIQELDEDSLTHIRNMLNSFVQAKKIKWSSAVLWVSDIRRMSDSVINKIGKDIVSEALYKLLSMCEISNEDISHDIKNHILTKLASISLSEV